MRKKVWVCLSYRSPRKDSYEIRSRTFYAGRRTFSRTGRVKNWNHFNKYFRVQFSGFVGQYKGLTIITET